MSGTANPFRKEAEKIFAARAKNAFHWPDPDVLEGYEVEERRIAQDRRTMPCSQLKLPGATIKDLQAPLSPGPRIPQVPTLQMRVKSDSEEFTWSIPRAEPPTRKRTAEGTAELLPRKKLATEDQVLKLVNRAKKDAYKELLQEVMAKCLKEPRPTGPEVIDVDRE